MGRVWMRVAGAADRGGEWGEMKWMGSGVEEEE